MWAQRNQAIQVVNVYAEALAAGKDGERPVNELDDGNAYSSPQAGKTVDGGELLGMMGMKGFGA